MNPTIFLKDFEDKKRAILNAVVPRRGSYALKEKLFCSKAIKGELTLDELKAISDMTALPVDKILSYNGLSNNMEWRGIYHGITYELDSSTFEVTFRRVGEVLGVAKMNDMITLKSFVKRCKEIIDNKEYF